MKTIIKLIRRAKLKADVQRIAALQENEFDQTSWKMKRILLFWRAPQEDKHLGEGSFNYNLYKQYLKAQQNG
jgi:hypothetical protein